MGVLDWFFFVPSLPRRWDGKNLSDKGTIRTSLRLVSGAQNGIAKHWSIYSTSISNRHLWADRSSVSIATVIRSGQREPRGSEQMSLDQDFVILPVVTTSGAELEWAMRSSQLDAVVARLGSVDIA